MLKETETTLKETEKALEETKKATKEAENAIKEMLFEAIEEFGEISEKISMRIENEKDINILKSRIIKLFDGLPKFLRV